MDKLSEAYSAIYESPLHPNLQKNEDNVKKKIQDQAAKNQQRDADRAKSASAFQAHKKSEMASGKRPDQALDSWQQKKLKKEGKYRSEWNTLKLLEKENHRETFDTWLTGIVEEGYDTDRWSDEELVEAFISENDLWGSRDMVLEALLEGYKPLPKEKMSRQADKAYAKEVVAAHHGKSKEANKQMQRRIAIQDPSGRRQAILNKEEVVTEEDKKGSGSGKKDACYKKVKASASVWPSAYASGRLVQCRKKGAANYGNSSKKEEVDHNLDEMSMSPVNQASQRQAERKLKSANMAKKALVNKIIKKDNKQDTKLQQKVAAIQMSSFSNWRDELDSLDENRMAAYNAGAGEGNEDKGISKSLANKMGRRNDEYAFKGRKNKTSNQYTSFDGKKRNNTTGRGQPERYRKSADNDDVRNPYGRSKIVQGTSSIKDLGKKK
jgi:hypothetical protein|tara:strand:+ start:11022 stop:12332 length:1311 start_codon:yes stop_codon:yes gene_type:complete